MSEPAPRHNSIHEAIDALFDGELPDAEARRLIDVAGPEACEDIAKTERLVTRLKAPVDAPDLTCRILDEVEGEREFLGSRWRTFVRMGRLAAAACLLFALLSVAVAQRVWPEATTLASEPRPVATLLQTTEREAVDTVRAINLSIDTASQQAGVFRYAVEQSSRSPSKITESERHVFVVAGPARCCKESDVKLATGAASPRFEAEVVAWRAPDPYAVGRPEYGTVSSFRSGLWSFDPGLLELQLMRRQQVEPTVTGVAFRKLP